MLIKWKKKNDPTLKKFLKKIFKNKTSITMKEQIITMFYYELLGIILCIIILFALTGGKNYFKLYYELRKLINVYDTITTNYSGEIDKNKMIDSAIDAMVSQAGDEFTTYIDQNSTTSFLENIDSTYKGIGCTVALNEQKQIYVVSLFENSPASQAGLQEGDIILKIDDQNFEEKTSDEMAKYVKNSNKSEITLTIKRGEEQKEIIIKREKVEIPTVSGKVIEESGKKIGYIVISIFSSITTEQFKSELSKLEKEKIQGLIIDVRNNTGGYLSSVTEMASMFLKKGEIIYQLETNSKVQKVKDKTTEKREYPIAVLINAASASASEILASAIKESYHGLVVGTNSYGKGTVQKTKKLSDGSMIKYTTEKWLTPNGTWINEVGVIPTDFIELKTVHDMQNNEPTTDKQFEKAKELILEKIK